MKKILAIDDNQINIELLKQIIARYYPDFIFLFSLSGEDGLRIAKEENPELILLDILMPGLTGFEVCEILKNTNQTKHIPVIMVSALGQDSRERAKGLDAGADAFISKPFNQTELRAQINVALRIKNVEDLLRMRNESLEFDIKDQSRKYLQNEERFYQIAEHAREFYWEIDTAGIFTYVSPVVEHTLTISPLDIMGKENFISLFKLSDDHELNEKLSNNSEFNDFELEVEIGNDTLWLSISGFSVVDSDGAYKGKRGVCYDITRRKIAEIELKENLHKIERYQSKLKRLNTEITLVEEKERRRIAENLHDSLGQTLSLAYLNLSSIIDESCSPRIKKTIEGTSNLLNKAISESRTLTYDLSPPILYELGLIPAIKWKLGQVADKFDIETNLIVADVKVNLKKENDIFLYRIVSELLTNINKHAKATKIDVRVFVEKGEYNITVKDNGAGFNKEKMLSVSDSGGYGLMSIIERLDSIQGIFLINSELNIGTEARITVPIV